MTYWVVYCCILVIFLVQQSRAVEDECAVKYCSGEAYMCINNECYCAEGYVPNFFQTRCIRCPGLGETCFGPCCNQYGNGSLHCRQGFCQPCYDSYDNWACRNSSDQMLLVSTTQIIMAVALILGIITTFLLMYRLCAATATLRPSGRDQNYESRLSIGSLQVYVEQRLRDAPPRYTSSAPPGSATYPVPAYLNAGFIHDSSLPPPPYTPSTKTGDTQNTAIHI
ncbi:unnamed protein product [Parnassius apollo]|uniref:(apollo) hypothetical protein n=1 Tax=Parnassius apollo TaxID=110799 RepID=A0A8S3X220_PARAO|nr:unnamed protein product [Parnassius apollo]